MGRSSRAGLWFLQGREVPAGDPRFAGVVLRLRGFHCTPRSALRFQPNAVTWGRRSHPFLRALLAAGTRELEVTLLMGTAAIATLPLRGTATRAAGDETGEHPWLLSILGPSPQSHGAEEASSKQEPLRWESGSFPIPGDRFEDRWCQPQRAAGFWFGSCV